MSGAEVQEQVWTAEEVAAFWEKVRHFQEGLPAQERDAFTAIVEAAEALVGVAPGDGDARQRTDEHDEAAAFWQKIAAFRNELPTRERDAFTTIVAAGAVQGPQGGPRDDDVQGYVVGLILYGGFFGYFGTKALLESRKEVKAPDLSGIPASPEEPGTKVRIP
jgi:hypothetical protein